MYPVSVAITRSHVIVETQVKRIVSDGYTLTDDYWFSNVPLVGTHHTENHVLDTLEDHEEFFVKSFQ